MGLYRWTGSLVLTASFLLLGAADLLAQRGPPPGRPPVTDRGAPQGPPFDPPGPPPTRPPVTDRGAPFAPPFTPPGPPPTRPPVTDRGGPFADVEGTAPPSLRSAAADLRWALRDGRLTDADGAPFGGSLQSELLALMGRTTEAAGPPGTAPAAGPRGMRAVLEALSPDDEESPRAEARSLAAGLRGLLADPGRLPTAVAAYNDFVRASTPAYLAEPPPAFLAVHRMLGWMVARVTPGAAVR